LAKAPGEHMAIFSSSRCNFLSFTTLRQKRSRETYHLLAKPMLVKYTLVTFYLPSLTVEQAPVVSDVSDIPRRVSVIDIGIYFRS